MIAVRALFAAAALVCLVAAPAAAQEQVGVQGSGTPSAAPSLEPGLYLDLIREPETLWYAVPAAPGQVVIATVVVRGRPDGPSTEQSELTAAVFDGQRQASGPPAGAAFNGTVDANVVVQGAALPAAGEGSYLAVTLASPSGANDLRDVGYQLEFSVDVEGTPSEPPSPAEPSEPSEPSPSAPPEPPSRSRGGSAVGDIAPVALLGFAFGGFLGFEGMRSRLRRGR